MVFLYSRKTQFLLLACWLAGLACVYTITAQEGVLNIARGMKEHSRPLQPVVGTPPVARPEPAPEPVPQPPRPTPQPPAAPVIVSAGTGMITTLGVRPRPTEQPPSLFLDLEYALANPDTLPKIRSYYIQYPSTVVIEFTGDWEVGPSFKQDIAMEEAPNMTFTQSHRHFRILVRTKTSALAMRAKVDLDVRKDGAKIAIGFIH